MALRTILSFLVALLVTAGLPGLFAQAQEPAVFSPVSDHQLRIFWTDTPPVVDGKADDACWAEAGPTGSFGAFRLKPNGHFDSMTGWAKQQTQARFAYDAEYLYALFLMQEPDGRSLEWNRKRPPPDLEEKLEDYLGGGDWVRLYFNPQRAGGAPGPTMNRQDDGLDLVMTPSGFKNIRVAWVGGHAMIDYLVRQELTPRWDVVVGTVDGGWSLEMRLSFRDLAQLDGSGYTPQPGEKWRLDVVRRRGADGELSKWTADPTSPLMDYLWRGARMWGWGTFLGPRTEERFPVLALEKPGDPGTLRVTLQGPGDRLPGYPKFCDELAPRLGPGAVRLGVKGATVPLTARLTVVREGKTAEPVTEEFNAPEGVVALPYRLLAGGHYQFDVEVLQNDRVIYAGRLLYKRAAPGVVLAEDLAPAQAECAKRAALHPAIRELRVRLEAFAAQRRDLVASLADAEEPLSDEAWEQTQKELAGLTTEWNALVFSVYLVGLYPGKNDRNLVPFALGAGQADDKFYRQTHYRGSLDAPIRLKLAGDEYGSYQLLLLPFWREVPGVNVTFSALEDGKGHIVSASESTWFREDYVKMTDWDGAPLRGKEYWWEPDILWPGAPFTAPAGQTAALWVDLHLPPGTPAGTYRGTVTVSGGGSEVSRSVEVTAYGFDLPVKSSLETDRWWSPGGAWYNDNPGFKYWADTPRYTLEMFQRHSAHLARYRVGTMPYDAHLHQKVAIYHEEDGSFTFDFTELDQWLQVGLDNHSTCLWSNFSPNNGWTSHLNSQNYTIIERATGEKKRLKDYYTGEGEPNWRTNVSYYRNNPVYRAFLPAWAQHLKDLGLAKVSYYEVYDEQFTPEMLEHHRFFREVAPDLQLACFGFYPSERIEKEGPDFGKDAYGLIDAWAPGLSRLHTMPEMYQEALERRAKYGEKLWVYSAGEGADRRGNYTPHTRYDRPYLAQRMVGWMAWKYQLDGYLLFNLTGMWDNNKRSKPFEKRWPNSEWECPASMWGGCLLYPPPTPDQDFLAGMRMANARDGLEDYEYFAVLRREAKKLDRAKHAALLDRVQTALEIEPEIVSNVFEWTKDLALLEAKRDQLAALIVEVRRAAPG